MFAKTVKTIAKNPKIFSTQPKRLSIKNIPRAIKTGRVRTHRQGTLAKKKAQKEFDKWVEDMLHSKNADKIFPKIFVGLAEIFIAIKISIMIFN